MRLIIGAIWMVPVPDTIMRSAWRGEAHVTIPNRSTSKREAKVAIISMAQHASPKVTGQIEDFRAQLKTFSTEVTMIQPPGIWWMASAISSKAVEALSPDGRGW